MTTKVSTCGRLQKYIIGAKRVGQSHRHPSAQPPTLRMLLSLNPVYEQKRAQTERLRRLNAICSGRK